MGTQTITTNPYEVAALVLTSVTLGIAITSALIVCRATKSGRASRRRP